MKKLITTLGTVILVFAVYTAYSQTPVYVTGPLNSPNTAGVYYNNSSVVLAPGFSTALGAPFQAYTLPANCSPLAINPTMTQNYILTTIPRIGGLNSPILLQNRTTCDVMQTIHYIDGLGRPLQTVQIKGSPGFNDVVQPFAYDQFGREINKYLPYTSATNDGSYKADALVTSPTSQPSFFINPPSGVGQISYPSAQTSFEASPLNRPIEQGAPGTPWQLSTSGIANSGHTVKITYTNNDQSTFSSGYTAGVANPGCRQAALYTVVINADESRTLIRAGNSATYGTSQLTVTITADENRTANSGCLNTVEQYTDKEGRIVLKRTYNLNNTNPATPYIEMLSTYYVYDDKGNLSFVLPPLSNPDAMAAVSQTTLDNLCYQYRYDGRNRLSQKKLSGKGWEFIIYNQLDQVVMTQDANQRNQTPQQWTFTKYDGRGHVVTTGLYPYPGSTADNSPSTPSQTSRQALESQLAVTTGPNWEVTSPTNTGYTNQASPVVTGNAYLTINYYDGYNAPNLPSAYSAPANYSLMTQGELTATQTAVLNTIGNTTPDMLWTAHYYDDLGRVTQSYSQHYLGGLLSPYNYDLVANSYDFTNEITASTRQHYIANAGNNAATLKVTI
ncbi:MAG: DUF6443 domain-containing protein, partial [Sphingobacteriales bacterium]